MHPRERCFIDPKSPMYRPEVRARKVATARKLGITIPPELLVDDAPPEKLNMLTSAYTLLGALGQDKDATERLVDELIDERQLEVGGYADAGLPGGELLGTIRHLDDGDVPQEAEAVVGGLNAVAGVPSNTSVLEQWLHNGVADELDLSVPVLAHPELSGVEERG